MRHEQDQFSFVIILRKMKNKGASEYALRDPQKPIGVSSFQLTEPFIEKLQGSLSRIEELEAELSTLPTTNVNDR